MLSVMVFYVLPISLSPPQVNKTTTFMILDLHVSAPDLQWTGFFPTSLCFFSVISISDQLVLFSAMSLLCFYIFLNVYHHPVSCPTAGVVVLPSSCLLPLFYMINTTAVCLTWCWVLCCQTNCISHLATAPIWHPSGPCSSLCKNPLS